MEDQAEFAVIGRRLGAIRKTFGAGTQKDWAEKHGFRPTQWNNWEHGTRRIPIECAVLLCDNYGLTLDYVYRGRRDGLAGTAAKTLRD